MVSRQRSLWLLLGLAAATGAGLSLAPGKARAQILDPTRTETRPTRPSPPPDIPDPSLSPDDQSTADSGWAPDVSTPAAAADAQDGIEPQVSAAQDAEAQDAGTPGISGDDQGDTDEFGEARARPRQLPPQDGDLPTVIEAPPPANEGIVDLNAPRRRARRT